MKRKPKQVKVNVGPYKVDLKDFIEAVLWNTTGKIHFLIIDFADGTDAVINFTTERSKTK